MKCLVLALATALLGTGCVVHDDTPPPCDATLTLSWNFRTADGAVVGCTSASATVPFVDVFVNDQPAGSFDCFAGGGTVAVPQGTSLVTVEGVDGSNRIVYRDEFNVTASGCTDQIRGAQPAEGRVNLDYTVSSAPPCANGPCYVWFAVRDDITGQTAAVVNATSVPTSYPYPNDVVFRLPAGPYTVDFMQVVSGGLAERFACTMPVFDVFPGATPGEQQLVPATPVLLKSSCP